MKGDNVNELSIGYWGLPEEAWTLQEQSPSGDFELTVQVVNEVSAFASLEHQWDELAENSSSTVFQTFDWQYLWWKHFATRHDCHMFLVLVKSGEKLIGIAPFYIQSYSILGFRIFRQLKFTGGGIQSSKLSVLSLERDGPSDYLDIIAMRGHERQVTSVLAGFLREKAYLWDEMYFQNIPEESIISAYLLPLMRQSGCSVATSTADECLKVDLPDTYEAYLGSLKKKARQHCRHACRVYFENQQYKLDDVSQPGKIDGSLEVLSKLHQKRWNELGYAGLFSDSRFESLHNDVAKTFAKKGRLWFKVLRREGKPVAAELGYKFNGRIYPYTSGFDEGRVAGSPHSSPGLAMKLLVVKDGISSGSKMVDLSRGGEGYKYDLTSNVTHNIHATVHFSSRKTDRRRRTFHVYRAVVSTMARVNCEIEIMRVMARQKKTKFILPDYVRSLRHRASTGSTGLFSRLKKGSMKLTPLAEDFEPSKRGEVKPHAQTQPKEQ